MTEDADDIPKGNLQQISGHVCTHSRIVSRSPFPIEDRSVMGAERGTPPCATRGRPLSLSLRVLAGSRSCVSGAAAQEVQQAAMCQ